MSIKSKPFQEPSKPSIEKGRNYGIKVVHDHGSDASIDVVFVHGLNGNAFRTWNHPQSKAHWPSHILPIDLPDARILTFGYDADIIGFFEARTCNKLADHAAKLVAQLELLRRRSGTEWRPICFVAHSLGGLVTAQALCYSGNPDEERLSDIERNIVGIAFLGVPFHGSGFADGAASVQGLTKTFGIAGNSSLLLQALRPNSTVLSTLREDFEKLRNQRKADNATIHITSFYEELPAIGGKWVVPRDSATLPNTRCLGIHQNHMEMARYKSKEDDGYQLIVGELQHWRDLALNQGKYAKELPLGPSEPVFMIPFRREAEKNFVRRERLLHRIKNSFTRPAPRLALYGIGGVGKSQLAIEYGYIIKKSSPETWILWVFAGSESRVRESYEAIADKLRVPRRRDKGINIFKLVHDWLGDEAHGKWLLILDNVDDSYMPSVKPVDNKRQKHVLNDVNDLLREEPYFSYIPQCEHGSVLVTSRKKELALKIVEDDELIEVTPMSEADAVKLLEKKLSLKPEKGAITHLAEALDYLPLALVQAAAFINNVQPQHTVQEYLEIFRDSGKDDEKLRLLSQEGGRLRRDREAKNSAITTLQMTFNYIARIRLRAAFLLVYMSFFDRQGIPEKLICDPLVNGQKIDLLGQTEETRVLEDGRFEKDMQTLQDFCLMSTLIGESYEMHSLVQLAVREWIKASDGQFDYWRNEFTAVLFSNFPMKTVRECPGGSVCPTMDYGSWDECRMLLPHVKSALQHRPETDLSIKNWAVLVHRAAMFAHQRGSLIEAAKFINALNLSGVRLPQGCEDGTITYLHCGAIIATDLDRLCQAEELLIEALDICKTVHDEEHEITIMLLGQLGNTYLRQEKLVLAEQVRKQVDGISERILERPSSANVKMLSSLELTYCQLKQWAKSREMLAMRMLKTLREQGYEEISTEVVEVKSRLASNCMETRELDKARQWSSQVFDARKETLGEDHPETLHAKFSVAALAKQFGELDRAAGMLEEVLERWTKIYDESRPGNLTAYQILLTTYWEMEEWKKAEKLRRQYLDLHLRLHGMNHTNTLIVMAALAVDIFKQSRFREAIDQMKACAEGREKLLGPQHPDTQTCHDLIKKWSALEAEALSMRLEESKINGRN